jgi:hypothetical protein
MDEKEFQVPPPCDNVTSPWIVAWLILSPQNSLASKTQSIFFFEKNSNKFFFSFNYIRLVNVLQTLLLIPLKHQMINDFTSKREWEKFLV